MGKSLSFPIECDGIKVGEVTAFESSPSSECDGRMAELSYRVDEAFRGRGLATEALRRVSEKLLREDGFAVLFCNCYVDNAASARVMEKAGFTDTGKLVAEKETPECPIRVFFKV
jgi:RimJ/RimL family protein N-acetyltransferase